MSENIEKTPTAGGGGPKLRGRTLALLGGGIALVLVVAGLAVPQIVHAQRVSEYADLVAQHNDALAERAAAQSRLEAASALTVAQAGEVRGLAQRVIAVAQTPEPILAAQHVQDLAEAGNAISALLGEPLETDEVTVEPLVTAIEALRAADAAAMAAADAAGAEAPEPQAPGSHLALDTESATTIIASDRRPEKASVVPDEHVTPEHIDDAKAKLKAVRGELADLEEQTSAEEARMVEIQDALAAAVPALRAAAGAATTQSAQVVEHTQKAPDASGNAVTAAELVLELAETDDVPQLIDGLAGYVEAAKSAQSEHAAAVEREAAAARGGSRNGPRLCARYSPWGGGTLVLRPCR